MRASCIPQCLENGVTSQHITASLREHHFIMRSSHTPALDAVGHTLSLFGSPREEPSPPPVPLMDWCKPEDAAVD